MIGRPIFQTTSQALHFAFLIQAYDVAIKSPMSEALRKLMVEAGTLQDGASSSIHFDGLDSLEVRAQCAMIRAAVSDRLPAPEGWAIEACFGVNEIIAENGTRRPVFSRSRYQAITRLSDWISPSLPGFDPMAIDLLVARAIDKRVGVQTFRELAERFGKDHSTYAYALKRVKAQLHSLRDLGISRLSVSFSSDGLVEYGGIDAAA